MKRFDNWPALLDEFVRSRLEAKFLWGVNDCCLFACDAVLVMTGEDLARSFRDTYATHFGAARALKEHGADSIGELADAIARRHELREVPPAFAQRGDVVLLDREFGESLGIVSLSGTEILAPADVRLAEVSFREARRAWRI